MILDNDVKEIIATEEDIDKIINSISETETKAADESQKYSLYIANLKKELKN